MSYDIKIYTQKVMKLDFLDAIEFIKKDSGKNIVIGEGILHYEKYGDKMSVDSEEFDGEMYVEDFAFDESEFGELGEFTKKILKECNVEFTFCTNGGNERETVAALFPVCVFACLFGVSIDQQTDKYCTYLINSKGEFESEEG